VKRPWFEGRQGSDDFWTTARMRRRSARRGGLGNELLRVDCVQTIERGAAGLAGASGVCRPRGVAVEQSKKRG
jgi:hypothetical protein